MARFDVAAALRSLDPGDGPLYRRLADEIEALIRRGELPPGSRLPSERRLAHQLDVSRGTVVSAYQELRSRDLLRSRQGSGTVVAGVPPSVHDSGHLSLETLLGMRAVRSAGRSGDFIDMQVAAWNDASDLPSDAFDNADPRWAELTSTPGYHPAGIPHLRSEVAASYTTRGLETSAEQILITCGAHQAITLMTRMCITPGDVAITEELTYPGAADALRAVGARVRTVGVGARGAVFADLERCLATDGPRLVYLIPSVHNPTGTVMPDDTRRQLVDLVRERNTVVIDDESLVDTLMDGDPPAPLAAFATDPETISRIFTVGSASKAFWGGLRVGWIRGPEPTIAMLTRLKTLADLASPVLSQLVCVRLLEQRGDILDRRRRVLAEHVDVLTGALAERLPEWSFRRPKGGLALWVQLPGTDASAFAEVAAEHGVGVIGGTVCSPDGDFTDHLRLSLGLPPEQLVEGVRRLEEAWRVYRDGARSPSTLEVVV